MSKMIYDKNAKYLVETLVDIKGYIFVSKLLEVKPDTVRNMLTGKIAVKKDWMRRFQYYCETQYDVTTHYIGPPEQREICQVLFLKSLAEKDMKK